MEKHDINPSVTAPQSRSGDLWRCWSAMLQDQSLPPIPHHPCFIPMPIPRRNRGPLIMSCLVLPSVLMRDLDEVINDAGMHERGMLHWMDHPEVGRVCLPSSPLRFADAPAPALKPSPFLNQHEEEVLGGIFGFSAAERAALREAGAISSAAQVKG